jgi:hypothetical protein
MKISLATGEFGRLTCAISDEAAAATATASNMPVAAADLLNAVENAREKGFGECFWLEASGDYRWVFRRVGANVRIALLWSTGTLTGWEHVFWTECPLEPFLEQVRSQITTHVECKA